MMLGAALPRSAAAVHRLRHVSISVPVHAEVIMTSTFSRPRRTENKSGSTVTTKQRQLPLCAQWRQTKLKANKMMEKAERANPASFDWCL